MISRSILPCLLCIVSHFSASYAFSVSKLESSRIVVRQLQQRPSFVTSPPSKAPRSSFSTLYSTDESGSEVAEKKLPMLLDPGTKGGALFLSLILFIIPFIIYNTAVSGFGYDEVEAGKWIGVGFTVVTSLAWASTYIFRVATKDMTYAKQLKDYENAVIAKRLEELDEDEVQALVEDIERDNF